MLLLLADLAGGGAERTLTLLLRHLDRKLFLPRLGLLQAVGPYLDEVATSDLMVADPPLATQGAIGPTLALRSLWAQAQMIKRFQPDLIVSATASMNLSAWPARWLAGSRARWLAREGNNTLATLRADSAGRPWLARLRHRLSAFCFGRADRVVATSRGVAEQLARVSGVPYERLAVVGNPVEIDRCPSWHGPASSLVAVGRLHHQKGFDVLLRALSELGRPQLKLTIIGEGPERLKLERLTRELGLQDQVEMPGFVEAPWSLMAAHGIFVSSSRWEGFGSAILEAMGCGMPVVVSGCDYGPAEFVSHEQCGLVVAPERATTLARALARLLENPELARRMGAAARKRAEQNAAGAIARRYESLFLETLGSAKRSPE